MQTQSVFPAPPRLRPAVPRDGMLETDVRLHHGGWLRRTRIRWRMEGAATAPVVVALGGISADRYVVSRADGEPGWWAPLFGSGRCIDPNDYRVLSFDYLDGSDTDGPRDVAVSTRDQAGVLAALLDALEIPTAVAIVGASYGAMVALAFGASFPTRARHLVAISGAHRAHPLSTAWRSLQRQIVRFGSSRGDADTALALARGLAMTTYRSPQEFACRFDQPPKQTATGFRFPVESYLDARGRHFAARVRPHTFLKLSESIDLHDIDPRDVRVPTTLVAVAEDLLVPPAQMQELAEGLGSLGRLVAIHSLFGHDAFLKEHEQLTPLLRETLEALQ